jgi:acetyl-CoA carboxylase carboxyl transferase subunit beta
MLFNKQLDKSLRVCPKCAHHFRLSATDRLGQLLDPGSWEERDAGLQSVDPLGFVDQKPYPERVAAAAIATGLADAAVWGTGRIDDRPVAICVMDFGFMGGSMGSVVGEKVTRAAEHALADRIPLVIVSASGGARMQEGTLSLMQLAKTMAAIERLREASVPFVSVMSDPTTGGVFASFAAVGDVNLAEPNALIGFAGARVSANTTGESLPPGFQRAEFLFAHGFVDRVVARADLRAELALLLRFLVAPREIELDEEEPNPLGPGFRPLGLLSAIADRVIPDVEPGTNGTGTGGSNSSNGSNGSNGTGANGSNGPAGDFREVPSPERVATVWEHVQLARNLRRPRTLDLLAHLADEWVELHGDRLFGDDPAVVVGLARIDGRRVVVVGQQKGADTEENLRRNFGMPHPEGYRKAMRAMELGERFGFPIVTFVDVPGAHPGAESEERGIAEAIATSIGLMTRLRTPIVAVITGEGGSGGALAVAAGDVVVALENAIYSVISPEGCAAILWRNGEMAPQAAAAMRVTAREQHALGVVDVVVPEPVGGAHTDHEGTADRLAPILGAQLDVLSAIPIDELLERRYRRYRAYGAYEEVAVSALPPAERIGFADRVRAILEARRAAVALPSFRRDEPPARGDV